MANCFISSSYPPFPNQQLLTIESYHHSMLPSLVGVEGIIADMLFVFVLNRLEHPLPNAIGKQLDDVGFIIDFHQVQEMDEAFEIEVGSQQLEVRVFELHENIGRGFIIVHLGNDQSLFVRGQVADGCGDVLSSALVDRPFQGSNSAASRQSAHGFDQVVYPLCHRSIPCFVNEYQSPTSGQAAQRFDAFVVVVQSHPRQV